MTSARDESKTACALYSTATRYDYGLVNISERTTSSWQNYHHRL